MNVISVINQVCAETQSVLLPNEVEEIIFLLENDVSIFHLSKTCLEDAVQEAILYITPDY